MSNQFDNVSVIKKSNVFFDGKCVSHTVMLADGTKKSVGVILPSSLVFNTGVPEIMEITAGACKVTLDGQTATQAYATGTFFDVPAKSGFTIEVAGDICEYICSFLP